MGKKRRASSPTIIGEKPFKVSVIASLQNSCMRGMSKLFKKQIFAVLLAILGCIIPAGCGGGSTSKNADSTWNAEASAKKEAKGESSFSVENKLPDRFPKEIPIIKGSLSMVALSTDISVTVSYEVKKSFEEVLSVYKQYYKSAGYTDMQELLIEDSFTGTGTLAGKNLLVMLSVNTDDPKLTSVSITYQDRVK